MQTFEHFFSQNHSELLVSDKKTFTIVAEMH